MPFDLYSTDEARQLMLPLDLPLMPSQQPWPPQPALNLLAKVLRDSSQWPKTFRWDFENMDSCAMGLTLSLWFGNGLNVVAADQEAYLDFMGHLFNLSNNEADAIFMQISLGESVTPEDVAARIEAHLKH